MKLDVVVAALLGVLAWSLLEYVIHRFAGHGRKLRQNPFAKEHIRHHVEGDYFAPTWKKLAAAALATAVAIGPAVLAAGSARGIAYVAGLISFYGVYEILHRRLHTHPGFGAYGRWARRHHFHHHFVDARQNHGVTSPLWDFAFGTYARPGTIKVPRRLTMAWLLDPRTGAVREEHADTFVVGDAARAG